MKSSIGPRWRGWLIVSLGFGSLFTVSAQVPTWQWAESSSFEKLVSIYGPGEDQTGALYIAGTFKDSLTLGSQFLKSSGFNDGYVAKLRRGRGWQWAVRINGGRRSDDYVQAMDVDAAGNVYVGGSFADTLYVGDTVLTNSRGITFFLAKFDSTGQFRWAAKGQALSPNILSSSLITALRVDNAGHVYVGGLYNWPLGVGSLQLPGGNNTRTFVARVTEAGSWEWATPTLGSGNCQVSSVEVDAAGNAYANGFIQGAVLFGSTSLVVRPTSHELFVACLRPTGS